MRFSSVMPLFLAEELDEEEDKQYGDEVEVVVVVLDGGVEDEEVEDEEKRNKYLCPGGSTTPCPPETLLGIHLSSRPCISQICSSSNPLLAKCPSTFDV